jgi:hypothetical protein
VTGEPTAGDPKADFAGLRELDPRAHGLLRAAEASSATLARDKPLGRDHCGNRLSYSNIGDEQPTI